MVMLVTAIMLSTDHLLTFFYVEGEIDYVRVINRVLPNDIRILGWCPAPVDFHARFVCIL